MGKIAIVTASFGGMDSPKKLPPQIFEAGYDFHAITEKNAPRLISGLDARTQGKFYKLQGHRIFPGYDALIWIDGNVRVKTNNFIQKMILGLGDADIAIPRHPFRNCLYKEAEFIATGIANGDKYLAARYDSKAIQAEAESYRAAGHPPDWGLFWCGLFARKTSERVGRFFDDWWRRCLHCQSHDQNSFPYLARKLALRIEPLDFGGFYLNGTYELSHHLRLQ